MCIPIQIRIKIFSSLFVLIIIVSCNSSHQTETGSETKKDSIVKSDDDFDPRTTGSVKSDDYFENQSLESIIKETTDRYNVKERIDTTLIIESDTFAIKLEHFCLLDSAIRLGKPYTEIYGIDSFITHNFASNLSIIKNGNILFSKQVTKRDFKGKVDRMYDKFGALLFPGFKFSNGTFEFYYSLSVPLTDVGIGIACYVDLDGNIEFGERH